MYNYTTAELCKHNELLQTTCAFVNNNKVLRDDRPNRECVVPVVHII